MEAVVQNFLIMNAVLCLIQVKPTVGLHNRIGDADVPLQPFGINIGQCIIDRTQRIEALELIAKGLG